METGQLYILPPSSKRIAEGGTRISGLYSVLENELPTITVITVVKNAKEGLDATLRSIFEQNRNGVEVIVIDGGSTDGTLEVLRRFCNKITYWVSEPDTGIYDAMNKGLSLVQKGSLILFLNAGDRFCGQVLTNAIVAPCLLPVKTQSMLFKGMKSIKPKIAYFFGMPYCHQGILFPFTNKKYDLRYKIASDLDFLIETDFKVSRKLVPTTGYIFYDNRGYSQQNFVVRDREIFKILRLRKGFVTSFIFKILSQIKRFLKKNVIGHQKSTLQMNKMEITKNILR